MKSQLKFKFLFGIFFIFIGSYFFSVDVWAADRYWVGATAGNVNTTTNWSTTSGGASGASVPGASDIAYFDGGATTNATVDLTWSVAGLNISSGYTGTITGGSGEITVGMNDFVQAGGTFNHSGTLGIRGNINYTGGTFNQTGTLILKGRDLGTYFDGQTGTTAIVASSTSINDNHTFTYAGWVKVAGDSSHTNARIITKTGKILYVLNGTTHAVQVEITTSATAASTLTSTKLSNGTWYHLIVTYDNAGDRKARVYINNVEASYTNQVAGTGTIVSDAAANLAIGGAVGGTRQLNGVLDELAIFNRVITSGERATLYGAGSPVYGNLSASPYNNGLKALWRMDEGMGTTLTDASGNNNTATLNNVAWYGGKVPAGKQYIDTAGTTLTVNNLTINKSTGEVVIGSDDILAVSGTLTLTKGQYTQATNYGGSLYVAGDIVVDNTWDGPTSGSGVLVLTGGASQTITNNDDALGTLLTVAKEAGTAVTIAGSSTALVVEELAIDSGLMDLGGKNLSVDSDFTIGGSGTLKLQGGETVSTPTTISNGGLVYYYGTSDVYTLQNWDYSNLTIAGSSTSAFTSEQSRSGLATTTISSGILEMDGHNLETTTLVNNGTLRIRGDETLTITNFDTDSGTVEYVGRGEVENLNITDFGAIDYYNLVINGQDPNFIFPTDLNIKGNLYHYQGTIDASSTDLTLGGVDQTISVVATTTLQTLTKTVTATSTLTFGTTSPIVITATTTLSGVADGFLSLRSASTSAYWSFDPQATTTGRVFSYLNVQDSKNINATAIDATNTDLFVDAGNNVNWTFASVPDTATVAVSQTGTQIATTTAEVSDLNLGGAFTFLATTNDTEISSISLKQLGSLATSSVTNLTLSYKEEESCSATLPPGTTPFGTAGSFDNDNVAITTGSLPLTADTLVCLYVTYDIPDEYSTSLLGRSIDFEITNPTTDIVLTTGSVTTTSQVNISGRTIIVDPNLTSVLSVHMSNSAQNPTVFYLADDAVWKMEAGGTPIRLTNPNLKVQSLVFTDLTGANSAGTVKIEMTVSNVAVGADPSFLNVTKTYRTTATVKAWGGNN